MWVSRPDADWEVAFRASVPRVTDFGRRNARETAQFVAQTVFRRPESNAPANFAANSDSRCGICRFIAFLDAENDEIGCRFAEVSANASAEVARVGRWSLATSSNPGRFCTGGRAQVDNVGVVGLVLFATLASSASWRHRRLLSW